MSLNDTEINFSKTPFTALTRPTNRSVVSRQLYMSLDGGWREDSLSRATRVGEFSRNALMERKMLTADKYIDCCCNPRSEYGEQTSSTNVCCIPLRVIFVVVFFAARSNEQWSAFPANCSKKCLSYRHLLSFTLLKRLTYRTPSSIYSSKNICTAVNRVVEVSKNVLSGFSWCIVSQSDEQRGETIVLKTGNCLQFFPFY